MSPSPTTPIKDCQVCYHVSPGGVLEDGSEGKRRFGLKANSASLINELERRLHSEAEASGHYWEEVFSDKT